jgi:DNA-binding phage protein
VRVFELDDVVGLLRLEVKRAGGQAAWAKETGTNRIVVNKILNGQMSPTKKIIGALNLRVVFVRKGSRFRSSCSRVAGP